KYIYIAIKERFDRKLRVGYTKTEMVDRIDDLQHELIREALRKTGITEGVEITTMGDIPSEGSGLGSSSTVTVGSLHAMYTYLGNIVPADQLAAEACEIEIDILGKPIGVQDQYITALGGLRIIEFMRDGQVLSEKVDINQRALRRLNENLMLFFTGVTRQADTILVEQNDNLGNRLIILRRLKELAYSGRDELIAGNIDAIGEYLHEGWMLKQQLASRISNPEINNIYDTAKSAGAIGGKITGAGGGGFLLLYCPHGKQETVRSALADLQELSFLLEHDGSKVIFNYKR
ncbi:MAG: GHMP kinase, partial [Anaerolineales bacterium]|nr:GHMP kinase [Anaerolineales bacterium]